MLIFFPDKLVAHSQNSLTGDIFPSAWVKTMKIIIKSYVNSECESVEIHRKI